MSVAQTRAARRKMLARYGGATRRRSIQEIIIAEKRKQDRVDNMKKKR